MIRQAAVGVALCVSLSMISCTGGKSPAPTAQAPARAPVAKPAPPSPDGPTSAATDPPSASPPATDAASASKPATTTSSVRHGPPENRLTSTKPGASSSTRNAPATTQSVTPGDVLFDLTVLRQQIDQYNTENPRKPYDGRTPTDTFWDVLIKGTYVAAAPLNPLQKSSTVARSPAPGVGWVWATRQGMINLYAVDASGSWLDESAARAEAAGPGQLAARAAQQAARDNLAAVRAAILDFHDKKAMETGQGRWPTLAELKAPSFLPGGMKENPLNHDRRIAKASISQGQQRAIVGNGEGWAYYEGTGGGQAVFYANTRIIGQNMW